MSRLTFCQALNQALDQAMARDPNVFLYGVGLPTRDAFFGSVEGLLQKYGPERVIDTPVAEETMLGFGLGAAVNGLRPVHHHIRPDFLLLAINQLVNMISSYTYGTAGKAKVPLVIRVVIGRGWGQGYQHSKSLHAWFAHIPGLKVVMPTTPRDAKGLLTAAIRDDNPVIFVEHRWLYWAVGDVPEGEFVLPLESPGEVLREGKDLTIVSTSWMSVEALKAAEILLKYHGVSVEVVDPKTIAPLDDSLMVASAGKTGFCIVADNDWLHCGLSAELAARISAECFYSLKSPVVRIGWAPTPCPTVRVLENEFYANAQTIVRAAEKMLKLPEVNLDKEDFYSHERRFRGPF